MNTIELLDEFREILSQFDPRGSAEITATLPSSPLLFFEKTACNGLNEFQQREENPIAAHVAGALDEARYFLFSSI